MGRWVQHISEKGDKWELDDVGQGTYTWRVKSRTKDYLYLYLPHSEYRVCDSPEVWENVTADCQIEDEFGQLTHQGFSRFAPTEYGDGYRLRKMMLFDHGLKWAFIVEKKNETR